eukprot:TRINITY_DN13724_c0_g1_i1.p1 TRINITY_DN13724_c0_g1~~TRINITY_DN13724_c0_g1_i1.p1  ORF type:complete len:845 (+),score=259.83 TRINITY_DN13724_c0_g1_i1:97-2631(+)
MPLQRSTRWGQFRGLAIKNATLQWRRKGTNLCQLAIPVLLVVFVGSAQLLFQKYFLDEFDSGTHVYTNPTIVTFMKDGVPVADDWQTYMIWQGGDWNKQIGNLTQDGRTKEGMLGTIPQAVNQTYDKWTSYVPYFNESISESKLLSDLDNVKNYWVEFAIANQQFPDCETCPAAAVIWNDVDVDKGTLDYTGMVDNQLNLSDAPWVLHTVFNMIDSAFLRMKVNNTDYELLTYAQPLYFLEQVPPLDLSSLLSVFLYPFALSFLLPVFLRAIVVEKEDRLREMMKMMGLRMSIYWGVMYLFNAVLYIIVMVVTIAVSLAFQLRFITQTSIIVQLLLWATWGMSLIAVSILLSVVFQKTQSATIAGYVIVIASVIVSYVLNYMIFNQSTQDLLTVSLMLYPPFAFYRGIYLIGANCTILDCLTVDDLVPGNEMFTIILMLFLEGIVYLVLALYLDQVFPGKFGVRKSPLFPLYWLMSKVRRTPAVGDAERAPLLAPASSEFSDAEDPDVANERERIYHNNVPEDAPIVLTDIRKVYDSTPPKVAVQSLCLSVERGECFGLLGPNGAGKTTTISILTGLYEPTSGSAQICGFDIAQNMDAIHEITSICPQFDVMWDTLTCRELLTFYARLKGVPLSEEREHVDDILYKVGLDQYSSRMARALSGGMRRRLSIGTALLGDPEIIFLDEPTTGLDPETRKHIWDCLLEVKRKNRSIVLTTHSMEEADVLSDRIGIMTKGRLRAIGSSLHLKNKYGEGYSLRINCDKASVDYVVRWVSEMWPQAKLVERFAELLTFQIKREHIVISEMFDQMEMNRERVGVVDWGISQTTIEDVFLKIAREEEEHDLNE